MADYRIGLWVCWAVLASVSGCGSSKDSPQQGGVGGGGSLGGNGTLGGSVATGGSSGGAGSGGTSQAPLLKLGLAQAPTTGTFTDTRDSHVYRWVEINGVRWMAENLNFVPADGAGVTCNYSGATERCDAYGHFYHWSTAFAQPLVTDLLQMTTGDGTYQGLCPDGWHLPTFEEWKALLDYVNGLAGFTSPTSFFGKYKYPDLSDPFRSTDAWTTRAGTNELGFDVKPYTEYSPGSLASFWTAREVNATNATIVNFYPTSIELGDADGKPFRHSIRCVSGAATSTFPKVQFSPAAKATGTFTDTRDGKTYYYVQIGNQKWMAENLGYRPTTGYSSCYEHQEEQCRIFGRFYDFATAPTVCPTGWHLPTAAEWTTLAQTVDVATNNAGPSETGATYTRWSLGDQFKSMQVWSPAPKAEPQFGFQALPAGFAAKGGGSGTLGEDANFWVSDATTNRVFAIESTSATLKEVAGGYEYSVRCLAD